MSINVIPATKNDNHDRLAQRRVRQRPGFEYFDEELQATINSYLKGPRKIPIQEHADHIVMSHYIAQLMFCRDGDEHTERFGVDVGVSDIDCDLDYLIRNLVEGCYGLDRLQDIKNMFGEALAEVYLRITTEK